MIFLWVIFYGVIFICGEVLSKLVGIDHIFTSFAVCLYAVGLIFYYKKHNKDPFTFKANDSIFIIVLLLIPLFNIIALKFKFAPLSILLALGVAVVEEIFFRGFLLNFLKTKLGIWGVYLSCLIFALFHLVNFANYNFGFVIMQTACAFCVALVYSGIAIKFKTVYIGAVFHFLTNATGIGYVLRISNVYYYLILAIISAINLIYGALLCYKSLQKTDKSA